MHPESPQNPHKVSTSCSQTAAKPLLSCKASTGNTTAGKLQQVQSFSSQSLPLDRALRAVPGGPCFCFTSPSTTTSFSFCNKDYSFRDPGKCRIFGLFGPRFCTGQGDLKGKSGKSHVPYRAIFCTDPGSRPCSSPGEGLDGFRARPVPLPDPKKGQKLAFSVQIRDPESQKRTEVRASPPPLSLSGAFSVLCNFTSVQKWDAPLPFLYRSDFYSCTGSGCPSRIRTGLSGPRGQLLYRNGILSSRFCTGREPPHPPFHCPFFCCSCRCAGRTPSATISFEVLVMFGMISGNFRDCMRNFR